MNDNSYKNYYSNNCPSSRALSFSTFVLKVSSASLFVATFDSIHRHSLFLIMFTGLIEEIGHFVSVTVDKKTHQTILVISATVVLKDVQLGDSISVNGVCLTVTAFTNTTFTVGLSAETLQRTTFAKVTASDAVNLERSLTGASHIGGHYVQGHVDGTATITARTIDNDCIRYTFTPQPQYSQLIRYIVEKGYIAIDGVSLTVTAVTATTFSVMIIQYTQAKIIMTNKNVGQLVNIECDIMGKQIVAYLDAYMTRTKQVSSSSLPLSKL